jgi:hypothetical protein
LKEIENLTESIENEKILDKKVPANIKAEFNLCINRVIQDLYSVDTNLRELDKIKKNIL